MKGEKKSKSFKNSPAAIRCEKHTLQHKPQKGSPERTQDIGSQACSLLVRLPVPTRPVVSHKILSIPINTEISKEPIYEVILIFSAF